MLRERLTLAVSAVPGERLEELELGIRGSCFCVIGMEELGCGRVELGCGRVELGCGRETGLDGKGMAMVRKALLGIEG